MAGRPGGLRCERSHTTRPRRRFGRGSSRHRTFHQPARDGDRARALSLIGAERNDAVAFLAQPVNAVLMALFIVAALMHMALGLQMVIEDYVTSEGGKVVWLVLNKFFAWIVGAAAIFALLKIALSRSLS